ncbi:FAD/FMN-dependent dehydrogenase [Azospira oryzae PS]|uniref:D-lactate dehydrogenase (cytochrome) n=2 Tax=Azospira oryzae TaxID=146939 RepID=G8QNZ3_AZOOP|nr:FAD-linked oxidase C-terminal domain-containing protein [Azospira oryzae]AEV24792.1 FAD/FMN-dependent dehydrogenase [Azospira oryzae PS]RZT76868.1 D-lactate dehydrogenase (cytochrome) [Azospira oryzae]
MTTASAPLPAALVEALRQQFGTRYSQGESVRLQHGRDESKHEPMLPDGVVFAESTEEVAAVVRLCREYRVPVIPYGVGSSVEGHVLAVHGGISIDLSGMNRVLSIHAEDLDVTVQAGVTRKQLNDELKGTGLFFPIDPGADATLGGMAATRASGTNAVRYGTMRENVLSLTVVTPEGKIVRTGSRARKSSAGYDLTRLFVGSEGTLGIITELTVKLYPIPEAMSAAVCAFPSVDAAVDTVIQTIQLGVPVARVELLDALTLQAINRYSKTTLPEAPTLFFEFHGSDSGVQEQAELTQEIAQGNGGQDFQWATRQEDRSRLWQARHDAYFACLQLKPGARCFPTDVCVPISRLAECIHATNEDIAQVSLPIALFGHVGDGNFHLVVLVDTDNPKEMAEGEWISQRVVERAIAMEGTCTGEHGIGLGKQHYLLQEHGEDGVALMRTLKTALDPLNLMNPGKILPPQA